MRCTDEYRSKLDKRGSGGNDQQPNGTTAIKEKQEQAKVPKIHVREEPKEKKVNKGPKNLKGAGGGEVDSPRPGNFTLTLQRKKASGAVGSDLGSRHRRARRQQRQGWGLHNQTSDHPEVLAFEERRVGADRDKIS